MSTTTVRAGQVWADNDYRAEGRQLRVDHIVGSDQDDNERYAICTVITASTKPFASKRTGHQARIRVSRMRPTSTGYRLISDPA